MKPKTRKDFEAVRSAEIELTLARATETDRQFAEYLLCGGLEKIMTPYLFHCESVGQFVSWITESPDPGAIALESLISSYGEEVKRRSFEIVMQWVEKYDREPFTFFVDQESFRAQQRDATPVKVSDEFRRLAIPVILKGQLLKADSFDSFISWLGSDDPEAKALQEVVNGMGARKEAAEAVRRFRERYADNQAAFDLDRKFNGPI